MLYPGALSQKPFKKRIYFTLWKLFGWHKQHSFHVTDEREKGFVIDKFGKETQVKIAGNFPLLYDKLKVSVKEPGLLKLVSLALVSPMKNYLLVLEALRKVGSGQWAVGSGQSGEDKEQTSLKAIEYNIYGPIKDKAYWEQCNSVIKEMPSNIVVNYHGAVPPAEIEEALAQNHVFILPSKSENFGHSIIEALSAGRPVITSNATPWNMLKESRAGINGDPQNREELVNAILFFVNLDHQTMEEWSKAAHDYAVKAINIELIKQQYREMFGLESNS